jgi:hypothetical protein
MQKSANLPQVSDRVHTLQTTAYMHKGNDTVHVTHADNRQPTTNNRECKLCRKPPTCLKGMTQFTPHADNRQHPTHNWQTSSPHCRQPSTSLKQLIDYTPSAHNRQSPSSNWQSTPSDNSKFSTSDWRSTSLLTTDNLSQVKDRVHTPCRKQQNLPQVTDIIHTPTYNHQHVSSNWQSIHIPSDILM